MNAGNRDLCHFFNVRFLRVALVLSILLLPVFPSHAGSEDGNGIRGTINRQLDAFQRDDWGEAFSYASPLQQKIFGTPEQFRSMVLGGYRAVYRPRQVDFRELDSSGLRPVQLVFFIGPEGHAYLAAYEMEQQPDGSWRIASVQMIRAPGASV